MPNVPTFSEQGYPGVVLGPFALLAVPAETPKPVIDKLNAALRKVTTSKRFADAMHKIGNEAKASTPGELIEVTQQQSQKWGELITRLNIKAE
jgi:tripartite-type tricarboxylate transporter receptor subunit TctC